MNKSKIYKIQTNVDEDVLKILKYNIKKSNMSSSAYIRSLITKAIMNDLEISDNSIVENKRANNDKVMKKVNTPMVFKKTKFKLGAKHV